MSRPRGRPRKVVEEPVAATPVDTADLMLSQVGVYVVGERRLERRVQDIKSVYGKIEEIKDLFSGGDAAEVKPVELLSSLEKKLHEMELMLKQASIPWGRGGDSENKWYSMCMKGWERLLAKGGYDLIDMTKELIVQEEELPTGQWDLLWKVKGWIEVEILPYAKMIADWSWKGLDVAPQFAVVVHQPRGVEQPMGAMAPQRYATPEGFDMSQTRQIEIQEETVRLMKDISKRLEKMDEKEEKEEAVVK